MAIIGLQKGAGKRSRVGKVSEKSGNFDMDNEWQPCVIQAALSIGSADSLALADGRSHDA